MSLEVPLLSLPAGLCARKETAHGIVCREVLSLKVLVGRVENNYQLISEPDWSCSLVIPNGRIRVAPISLAYHEMV